jgi:hypothetical protein
VFIILPPLDQPPFWQLLQVLAELLGLCDGSGE